MTKTINRYYALAKEIADGKMGTEYIYCLNEKKVYKYSEGIWVPLLIERFIALVNEYEEETCHWTSSQTEEFIKKFKILKNIELDDFNKCEVINFQNGMYDPSSDSLGKHKPEYYSTTRLPYKYNSLAQCDLWIKTLNEIFEGNYKKIELLQEFFGYCLSAENEQKKGLLLLGETDTGKSTIIDTFKDVIGSSNISNVPLHNLADPQHNCGLVNMMVNIDPDVNKNAIDYEREFKIITSGKSETIRTSPKFVPTFEFIPKCKLILAANIFPRITDPSSAFYQRLLVVPCERRFSDTEKDRLLNNKLKLELPGIFNWMIKGLHRLKKRGYFNGHDFLGEAVQDLRDESNPVDVFFREHIEEDVVSGYKEEKGELYKKYDQWCKDNGNRSLSAINFGKALYQKYQKFTPKKCQDHITGKRIWLNIRYVTFKNDNKQEITLEADAISNTSDAKAFNDVQPVTASQQDIKWD